MNWDQRYIDSDTPWDKNQPAPILTQLLKDSPDIFLSVNNAISLGCGIGHDSFELAKNGIKTTGFDLSSTAIQKASEQYQHPNLKWQVGDLFSDLPESFFDLVWEHTCYCATPPSMRLDYIEAVADTLKNNGLLLAVFFIDTGNPTEIGPPHSSTITELKQSFSKRFKLLTEFTPQVSYQGREGKEHLMLWQKQDNSI